MKYQVQVHDKSSMVMSCKASEVTKYLRVLAIEGTCPIKFGYNKGWLRLNKKQHLQNTVKKWKEDQDGETQRIWHALLIIRPKRYIL